MWTVVVCSLVLAFIVALDFGLRYLKYSKYRASLPLPPGPPGLPFVGNVIGINPDGPWMTYAEWAKVYGDLMYTSLFGKHIIIINSLAIAKDLLEGRSSNYSDRPELVTFELCGVTYSTGVMHYGDRWRLHRKFFHQTFQNDAVRRFLPLQHRRTCQLLRRLFDNPGQLSDHIFEYTASIILNSVYDYDPKSSNDELIDMAAKSLEVILRAARPDVALVLDAFPMLIKLPSWLPGMSFKRDMDNARQLSKKYVERPFQYSLHNLLSNGASPAPSMVHDALLKVQDKGTSTDENWMETLKEAAATGFIAAAETSNAVIMTFYLLMTAHPEAQAKAQAQIDTVVGRKRLPSFQDRPSLPYIDAILRETIRFNPVVPLSLPHATIDDDVYDGYHIPKGAVVLPNLWSMGHDESKYPNSDKFIPERFLNEDGSLNDDDVNHLAYGFGRRMCSGRHFADTSVWSVMAKVLATFTISKAKDENGVDIPVELRFANGLAANPLPFKCSIVPRTPGMDAQMLEQLIQASEV